MKRLNWLPQKISLQLLLAVPVLLYLTIAVYWHARDIYSITGDEPHYLLIADSIIRDRDLRVENNYQIDTPVQRAIKLKLYVPEWMPIHVYNQFSLHNIGLPLLLAPAYALAGVMGAKIFMALLAGLWPLLFYRILLHITESETWSAVVAFALAVGLPFTGGSNQITPDLLAGMVILYLAWKIFLRFDGEEERSFSLAAILWPGALIAFLPWLHIRLVAPAGLLIIALVYTEMRPRKSQTGAHSLRYLVPIAVFACSFVLLAIYNHIAFGSASGPYNKGSVSFDVREVAMIFLGLHWDQAQGMFIQQPLFLLGLVGMAPLIKANWRASLLLGVLYLSLMMPNSMHTTWYGGFSFTGRFGWTAAPLWIFPLAFTVKSLLQENRLLLKLIVTGSIVFQVWLAVKWVFHDGFLIMLKVPVWATRSFFDDTGLLFALPSFKDFDIYLRHPPNYVFVAFGILLAVSGWLQLQGLKRLAGKLLIAFAVAGVIPIMLLPAPFGSVTYESYKLPREIGSNDGLIRMATEKDGTGMLIFGPYVMLPAGLYELNLDYETADVPSPTVGRFDVVYSPGVHLVSEAELPSADANGGIFKYQFPVRDSQSFTSQFEFRVWYAGHGNLRIKSLKLTPVLFDQ